ncbi:MAG: efflux RND transporter periplasmic adaptor subunit [Candidatus Scalindua sp.]
MRNFKSILITGIILVSAIAGITIFFMNSRGSDSGKNKVKFKEVIVERGTFQIIVMANGIVKSIDRIEIKSKASGEIVELPVEEGDFISQGDLIARLDQKDERTEVAQAQADFDIAKAELKQAQSTFDRRNQLFQDKLISEEEQDQTALNLAVAKGKVVRASTTLERAQERLSEAVVRAPIDGIILQKYVEKGQIIASGMSNFSGGTPIVDIANMSSVYIETGIDEIDIGKVQIGQFATVIADAYPELEFNGKIVRIAPEARIEQNVTLFDLIVEVKNNDGKLKSGMNTRVEIEIVKKENVLLAPAITMQIPDVKDLKGHRKREANIRKVLLKQGDGFIPQIVEIGLHNFKQVIILAGVEEGSVLGVPMTSRLKAENERLEERIKRIRSSRSFGSKKRSSSSK